MGRPVPEGTPETPQGPVNLPGAHSFPSIAPPRTTERTADSQGRPEAPPYSAVGDSPHSLIQQLREQNGVVHINFVDFDPSIVGNMPPGLNLLPQTPGEDMTRTMQIFVDEHAHAQLHGMGFHTDFEVRSPSNSRPPGSSERSSSPPPSQGGPTQRDSPMPDTEPEARQASLDEARREQEDPLLLRHQLNSNSQQQRRRYDRFRVEELARHPGASFQEGDDPEEYMRLRMLPRVEPMYFFAFHEEDLAAKASKRALRSLRRVPLADLLVDDRDCSICYEPMTDYSGPTSEMDAAAEPGPPLPESNESGEGIGVKSNTHEWDPEDHSPLVMPVCGHVFGTACLRSWLDSAASCPICRRGIDAEPASRQLRFEHTIPFRLTPTERIRLNQDNTPFRGPTDPAAFETEVTEMLNSFRGAQVLENSEQRNMAFVRIIEAVMRQVAQRVAPDNPHVANETAASATSSPGNSSATPSLARGSSGGFGSAETSNVTPNASSTENTTDSISNSTETIPTNTSTVTFSSIPENRTESSAAADSHTAQGPSLFRDRDFRLPENAVPSLAELRARQSEIMRQALQSAQSGIAQLSREEIQQTPHGQSLEHSQEQPEAQGHSEGQPQEQPNRPAFTMQFHQPFVIPSSRIHVQAIQNSGMPNEGILNTLRQQFPMFRRSSPTSQENTDSHEPPENNSGHNQQLGDSQMVTDGDELGSEERRSGPSRRTAFRRHPYPRNDAA